VVIDLTKAGGKRFIEVKKAGGRYNPETYQRREYSVGGLKIEF